MKSNAIVFLHKKRLLKLGKPKMLELGKVIDISWGGLSVLCDIGENLEKKASALSILVPPGEFELREIPFMIVSDCLSSDTSGSANPRRCGISFGELNKDQKRQLVDFIKKHAIQGER